MIRQTVPRVAACPIDNNRAITPSFTAADEVGPRPWKVVGRIALEPAPFCNGGPTGSSRRMPEQRRPESCLQAPCRECLTDLIMTRIAAGETLSASLALARDTPNTDTDKRS